MENISPPGGDKTIDLQNSWYMHIETNFAIAAMVAILTGMTFCISLEIRQIIFQVACLTMSALFNIDPPNIECDSQILLIFILEFFLVLFIVMLTGWVSIKLIRGPLQSKIIKNTSILSPSL